MLSRLVSLFSAWTEEPSTGSETATRAGDRGGEDGGERTDGEAAEEDGEMSLTPNGTTSGASNGAANAGTGAPTTWQDLLDGEEVSKQEVQVELGLQPHEFLAWLVRSSGGRMWQADMVETTGWSKSTVSRYLDTLESDGVVERVQIGRRKLVGVPEQMPAGAQVPDNPPENASADLGSWADEAA